jgi:uncharacterized repeat protein (TIGR03803 family)
MTKLSVCETGIALFLICVAAAIAVPAQTFTTLAVFDGTNGASPEFVSLVQGVDGNFYGTTGTGGTAKCTGGIDECGTIFRITPAGALTATYSFCPRGVPCGDGADPVSGLAQATDGNLYGTATQGGSSDDFGTVFRVGLDGDLTPIYRFCNPTNCSDGWVPDAPLVEGIDGNLYGTTVHGGGHNGGTVFTITLGGALTTLYNFCARPNCTDGNGPIAGLTQGADGNLYGMTNTGGVGECNGGQIGCGTVFRITRGGKLTTLYRFCSQTNCADGSNPIGGLTQASDGNFYGTTTTGGANCTATGGCGTVFKITSAGTLATLYNFCSQPNCIDGSLPSGGMVQATDGNLYGTTSTGGTSNCDLTCGTIFEITPTGELTTLYSFCTQVGCPDGKVPLGGLLQSTNGVFYGTTNEGGPGGGGTVFSLATGMGPFVTSLPAAGNVGAKVGILGTNLDGASGVTFNGIPAEFSVRLPTLIVAHVPPGATTGFVTVTTPTGVLTSNVPFRVIP